jgi:NAD(P)-dependent dehydrogenase (short-subunit alcohol dehydrogenase family)
MTTRNWLITGVSSGFGRELATQLLNRGDTVVGTVRRPDNVADLLQKYPDTFHRELLDVTDAAAVREVTDRSFSSLGRIDVVVSNAGYGLFGAAEELSDEQVSHIIATNLTGSIQLIRAALPHLRAQGSGRIIQMSTYGGQVAFPGNSRYHATKWGIEGFAESVAQEVAPFGIGVTIVELRGARTEFRYGSAQVADPLPAYDGNPAHAFQAMLDPANGLARATRPGWPPPSSPASASSPHPCASCWDHRPSTGPSASSRTASPPSRRRPTWPRRPTSRPARNQNSGRNQRR